MPIIEFQLIWVVHKSLHGKNNNKQRLSPCPRGILKLLKPPLRELRKLRHDISAYIDDTYLQDNTKEKCITNIIDTATLLRSLGFTVSAKKLQFLLT